MRNGSEAEIQSAAGARARLASLIAAQTFGDGLRATNWLVDQNDLLGGRAPLTVAAESAAGYTLVRQHLRSLLRDRVMDVSV
jgi:hypothetical protein